MGRGPERPTPAGGPGPENKKIGKKNVLGERAEEAYLQGGQVLKKKEEEKGNKTVEK